MSRLTSKTYRDASRDQPCSVQIPGVCRGGGEDTVFAHLHDSHSGGAIKASDISGCDADFWCHEVLDRRAKMPDGHLISETDWTFFALRGLRNTLENRIQRGILIMPADATETRRTSSAKPKKIASPGFSQAHRPLRSRPFRKGMK